MAGHNHSATCTQDNSICIPRTIPYQEKNNHATETCNITSQYRHPSHSKSQRTHVTGTQITFPTTTPSCTRERHEERIVQLQANVLRLEEEVKILSTQRFFLKRFEGSDSDIQFYTGLSSYPHTLCLCVYIDSWNPYYCHLRLCRCDIKSTSTPTFKSRTRALQPIDELYLVLIRLRLGLLEQDLAILGLLLYLISV